jgi:HlyD family secretion protein
MLEVERRHQIWLDRADLQAAQIKADVATQQYNAAAALQKSGGAISSEEVQNRKLSSDLAAVEVERLKRQELIQELDYKTAQDALSNRNLIAPTNGIISEIIKKPGESAQAYEPVIKMCDVQKIVFVANLPENIITTLREGAQLPLRFTNVADPIIGTIKLISPLVDPATGLRKIKIDLPDGLPWMRPGLTADLMLTP